MNYYDKYKKYKYKYLYELYGGGSLYDLFEKCNTEEDLVKYITDLEKNKKDTQFLHSLFLLLHPDKNTDINTTEYFQKIQILTDKFKLNKNNNFQKNIILKDIIKEFKKIYQEYLSKKNPPINNQSSSSIGIITITAIGAAVLAGIFFAVTGMWGGSNIKNNGLIKFSNIFNSDNDIELIINDFKTIDQQKVNNGIENLHILLTKNIIDEDKEKLNNNMNYLVLIKCLNQYKSTQNLDSVKEALINFRKSIIN
jgi:hypothetical protein